MWYLYCLQCTLLQEKWVGLLHHVTNEHEWLLGECKREELQGLPTDTNGQEIAYLDQTNQHFKFYRKLSLTGPGWNH